MIWKISERKKNKLLIYVTRLWISFQISFIKVFIKAHIIPNNNNLMSSMNILVQI